MKYIAICDIETTALPEAGHFHCAAVKIAGKDHPPKLFTDLNRMLSDFRYVDKWVFHNGLGFDVPKINELVGYEAIKPEDCIDTMVVSKLVDYKKFNTHSLKEIGVHLKVHKGDYDGGWDTYTKEMGDYCIQDVVVLEAMWEHFKPYIMDPTWADAMRLEHDMAIVSHDMQRKGFKFKIPEAEEMLASVTEDMKFLEDGFSTAFPPKLVPDRTIKMRRRLDGKLYPNVLNAMATSPKVEISDDGEELVIFESKEFNPASTKQRVDVLWDAGWLPTAKTKGHKKFLMEQNRERRGKGKW